MSRLRYIQAERVDNVGRLAVHVDPDDESRDHESRVGDLDGIIVDPAARLVRFLVIQADGPRYLLPLCPTRLDHSQNALHVMAPDAAGQCETFDPADYPEFDVEDVVAFMFPPRGASHLHVDG